MSLWALLGWSAAALRRAWPALRAQCAQGANLAALLLAIGAARHYGWSLVPPESAGLASKGLGGAASLALLACILALRPSVPLAAVVAWYAWEDAQIVLCTVLYAVQPWPVGPGQPMCSARWGIDLGAVGIVMVAALAAWLWSKLRRLRDE